MGVAESLLPGMTAEKRFNVLRGLFAAGYAVGVLMFFIPCITITQTEAGWFEIGRAHV